MWKVFGGHKIYAFLTMTEILFSKEYTCVTCIPKFYSNNFIMLNLNSTNIS